MAQLPSPAYLPIYINDWLGSPLIARLGPARQAVFLWLLLRQMQLGRLPREPEELAALLPFESGLVAETWAMVRDRFEEDEGGLYNPKTDAARAKGIALSELHSERARKARQAQLQASSKPAPSRAPSRLSQAQAQGVESLVSGTSSGERATEPCESKGVQGEAGSPSPAGAGSPRASRSTNGRARKEAAWDLEGWVARHAEFGSERFRAAWAAYEEHRARGPSRSRLTGRAREIALGKLLPLGPERAADCLEQSVMNGWQGVFPERASPSRDGGLSEVRAEEIRAEAQRDLAARKAREQAELRRAWDLRERARQAQMATELQERARRLA